METYNNIVFFDGVCTLCNSSIDFLIRVDKKKVLKYSSLQGELAKNLISEEEILSMNGLFFWSNQVLCTKSQAVINIFLQLGGKYALLGKILNIFPFFILDIFYNLIARYRYLLFGKEKTCRIPKDHEKDLFID